jgi:hypothetical protein
MGVALESACTFFPLSTLGIVLPCLEFTEFPVQGRDALSGMQALNAMYIFGRSST